MHQENCSLFRIILLAVCLAPSVLFSQSTLTGTIKDEATGEPIPFASVYLNNTTIGASSREDGSFEIRSIPDGKYELTVSTMGYKKFQGEIEFRSTSYAVNISLKQDPVALSEVIIKPDPAEKKYLATFKKYFLGETSYAAQCEILNPDDLIFSYERDSKILLVKAQRPIVIDNKALGYKIYYSLDFFEFDYKKLFKKFQGSVRFENKPGMDHRDSVRCLKRREIAYNGSLMHFMRSLYKGQLKESGYFVYLVDSATINKIGAKETEINLNKFLTGTSVKKLDFKGYLRIEYVKESEDPGYRLNRRFAYQSSYLVFRDPYITVFSNGYFMRQLGVETYGYYGWSEVLGESTPYDYVVDKK